MRLALGVVVTRVLRGQGQAHRFVEIPEERSGFFLRLRQNARVGKRRSWLILRPMWQCSALSEGF